MRAEHEQQIDEEEARAARCAKIEQVASSAAGRSLDAYQFKSEGELTARRLTIQRAG